MKEREEIMRTMRVEELFDEDDEEVLDADKPKKRAVMALGLISQWRRSFQPRHVRSRGRR